MTFEPHDLPERFRHIDVTDRSYATPCWVWTRALDGHGYGTVHWQGKTRGLHRLVYQLLVGPTPSDLAVDHLCRVPACINPAHMELVTHTENQRRGMAGVLKTHCIHGHEFTPENTYVINSRRSCRACNLISVRAYQKRRVVA